MNNHEPSEGRTMSLDELYLRLDNYAKEIVRLKLELANAKAELFLFEQGHGQHGPQ